MGVLNPRDGLCPKGRVELFVTQGKPKLRLFSLLASAPGFPKVHSHHELDFSAVRLLDSYDNMNIIVNQGKDKVIQSLTTGFINVVARMAIGDRGTLPSDQTVPKVAVPTQTALFNEVYRGDMDATIVNIGTPTAHEVKFVKTFSSTLIPLTAYSNQASPVVNEAGLIVVDLLSGQPLPRTPVSAPAAPNADERLFSLRTFKSVPFEAANDISITIRYTIFIE
jgi:hypothetical protein